jgi:inner membrane protein
VAALLPDVDHPGSWAGRRTPGLSFGINLVAGHRGVLHSLLGAGLVTAILCWLSAYLGLALPWRPVLVGYLSHLALDTLTPGGVAWLFPFKRRVSFGIARTGGGMERFVFLPLLLVCLGWLFHAILPEI